MRCRSAAAVDVVVTHPAGAGAAQREQHHAQKWHAAGHRSAATIKRKHGAIVATSNHHLRSNQPQKSAARAAPRVLSVSWVGGANGGGGDGLRSNGRRDVI